MNDGQPSVSVVITNHNYGCFLHDALRSVFEQSYAPCEVIVVDDGSVDDSRSVLSQYGTTIRAIFQANAGQAAALDTGVAASNGEIICLLDADDVWLPGKIHDVVRAFETKSQVMWLRHDLELADAELQRSGMLALDIRRTGMIAPNPVMAAERIIRGGTSALCFRRQVVRKVFPLYVSDQLRYDADALLVARLAREYCGYELSRALVYYRRHGRQQYSGTDMARVLERQIKVSSLVAAALGTPEPVSNHNLRTILAAMAGEPLWSAARFGPAARGLAASLWRFRAQPALLVRKTAAQLFAWLAPAAWLRRQKRVSGFT